MKIKLIATTIAVTSLTSMALIQVQVASAADNPQPSAGATAIQTAAPATLQPAQGATQLQPSAGLPRYGSN
jgi:hypothetical protein